MPVPVQPPPVLPDTAGSLLHVTLSAVGVTSGLGGPRRPPPLGRQRLRLSLRLGRLPVPVGRRRGHAGEGLLHPDPGSPRPPFTQDIPRVGGGPLLLSYSITRKS